MFKTSSIEKMRNLGNKLDANNPINYGVFKKNYSYKNTYDRFSILTNRIPIQEYHGVIIPDWITVKYDCIMFTEYVSQMNKLVEAINFASDSYWGDPQKYRFRVMIDLYSPSIEVSDGEDRAVKTAFTISLFGHIIPDSINSNVAKIRKSFSKAALKFNIESTGNIELLQSRKTSPQLTAGGTCIPQKITVIKDEVKESWLNIAVNIHYTGNTTLLVNGEVLEGVYKSNTIYRFIANTEDANGYPTEDSFYTGFNGFTLLGLIVTRNT